MSSMMSPVVSSLVYSNMRRAATEVFPPNLRKLWKEWDLRGLVLLSLTLQVALIILGNRRKYNHKLWIRFVIWSAYLAADYIASCALGVLSNNLADMRHDNDRSLDTNVELTALWAPFLLLHLGGPDTITAYALEDNELWLRHLLGLIFQAGTTFYVLLMAWTGSYLSIICISMFFVGLIKYGERTWVLRSVSNKKLGESTQYYFGHSSSRTTRFEQQARSSAGYRVELEKLTESCLRVDFSVDVDKSIISDEDSLCVAYGFFDLTKCFFLDAILSSNDKDNTLSVFKNISSKSAFKVIETELGFMYDLYYTKAPLLHTWWGLGLRLITFFLICLTCSVLIIFSFLDHKHKYSKADISTTFILFAVAFILEIYSALVLVTSDRFVVWLSMHNKISTSKTLSSFPLFKGLRWSNTMPQYSFLNYCVKLKPLPCLKFLKHLNLEKRVETCRYVVYKEVSQELKDLVFGYCKRKAKGKHPGDYRSISRGGHQELVGECPNFEAELGKSILFWHIVTELLWYFIYEEEIKQSDDAISRCEPTKAISEYILYLLVVNPSMLSTGNHRFQSTVDRTTYILRGKKFTTVKEASELLIASCQCQHCQEGDSATLSLLSDAVSCAQKLSNGTKSFTEVLEMISEGWLDILVYAASKCNPNHHAQQLRNGGELLTHVWLLMAHFGLTNHFQIKRERRMTRLVSG